MIDLMRRTPTAEGAEEARRPRRRGRDDATRRRFVRRQWARRWLAWRYVVASVVVVALVVGGGWLVWFSSVLTVKHVTVQGEHLLSEQRVLDSAGIPSGAHLATLDLDAISARIRSLAPVRSVDVSRDWPDGVLIKVTERKAVAVVSVGGDVRGMDSDGVLFRSYRGTPPPLPRVETTPDTGSDALAEAAQVIAALPPGLSARVDHVQVRTVDQIDLVLQHGAVVVWGSADQSAEKAQVLSALLHQPARRYDVSVPGRPVTSQR